MKQTILTAPNAQKSPKIAIRVLRNMATIGNSSDDVDSSHIYKYNVSQKTNNHRHLLLYNYLGPFTYRHILLSLGQPIHINKPTFKRS